MKFFKKASHTTSVATATTMATAKATVRKVEFAKNILAVYGGVRLGLDIWNAVKVARLIKAGKIAQGDDGYWYYTDTQSDPAEEGGDDEEEEA